MSQGSVIFQNQVHCPESGQGLAPLSQLGPVIFFWKKDYKKKVKKRVILQILTTLLPTN